jgi:hypothetical protein
MEPVFQRDQRVKQISTGRVDTIMLYDQHPTYHVQFDGRLNTRQW